MDEETTPTTQEEAPAPEEASEQPAPDIEALKAEIEAERKQVEKDRKALQKGFEEIARRERTIASQPPDDAPELDEAAQKAIDAHMRKQFGGYFADVENMRYDIIDSEFERTAEATGLDVDTLKAAVDDNNIVPKSMSRADIRFALERAAKIVKADALDPEALEKQIEDKVREKLYAELAEKGVNIESVVPKKGKATSDHAGVSDDDLTPEQRIARDKDRFGW